ncbi:unnamed protein product [Pocillopora meandrina]|uniref:Uncharacterized protein n=1 Tax=Pocillopora meandrina TaxID=46732 RepID=A0AAU9Y0D5_9CNID|nr:unnamed protein product [Pocillopora meandrina]
MPPYSLSLAVSYIYKAYKISNSYAPLLLSHATPNGFHSFFSYNNPLHGSVCHNLLEAAKHCKLVTVKKASIPADINRSFGRFFRYDELNNIAPAHLKFCPESLRVFVPMTKNYVFREGRLGNSYCPVALLERYIWIRDINLSSSVTPFRPVRQFKSTSEYKLYGEKLSYTRCREIFKDCLKRTQFRS